MAEWVPITDPNDPRLSDTPLNDSDPFADLGSDDPFEDAVPKANVRIMAYGPVVGEHHKAAMFGPNDNELQPYDVAASPNLGLKLGEWIEVNGQARRVADWSYIKPGVPTKDTIEIRDAKDQGRGTINRIALTPDEIQRRISEYPQLAGEKTQGAERKAVEPADVKGDPFADLIPTEKAVAPVGADPFADLTPPPPRGFKDVGQGQPLPESPTPTPIELPDATRTPEPTPQRRAPAISAPTTQSPVPTLSPVALQQPFTIPTGGQPIPPPIEAPGALPAPQGEEDPNMMQKTARALGAYAGQMIPQSWEQAAQMAGVPTDLTDPFQDLKFLVPPLRMQMDIGQQAFHRMQQIQEAEQTPAMSQQRFDAGIGTALDLLGMMGLVGGVKVGMRKPTVTSQLPKVEVATAREVPVPEAFQPKGATFSDYLRDLSEGNPVTLYHGTQQSGISGLKSGTSLTHSRQLAEKFAGSGGTVHEVQAGVPENNPLRWSARSLLDDIKSGRISEAEAQQEFMRRASEVKLGERPAPQLPEPLQFTVPSHVVVERVSQIESNLLSGGEKPPAAPPPSPPTQPQLPLPPEAPQGSESVNPVRGSGKFVRSYRIDKELGDRMEGIGAARESGALRAETEARNLLDGLTPAQETDLGRYLVSRRLKTVNPDHPQIISDIEMRRIESDPALTKALDYYKAKIKPDIEGWRKRAGLSEEAAAGKEPEFISLIPKTMELIPQQTTTGRFINPAMLPRTTQFARAAAGFAKEYAVNMRDILTESYGEVIRKARTREFYDAAVRKGVMNKASVRMPDGNFVKVAQFDDLPPQLQHDLTEATKANLAPVGLQKVGRIYQRVVTGAALTANPAELVNHMRRQLNLVAAKAPVGHGLLARLEGVAIYFGPKLGAFKRAVMDNASSPEFQSILKDIFDAGGGSTRSFEELYGAHPKNPILQAAHKYTGLEWLQGKTQKLLFGIPKGYGIQGFDLRMRVALERIRRAVEGNTDPQAIRENANQIGEYGRHKSWVVEAVQKLNPYAATTLRMRLTELKTAIGMTGFREPVLSPRGMLHRAETLLRGTGGTVLALATANYLLAGKWPWENDKGHEFDLNTGVTSKDGKTVYVKLRAIAPELSRPVSTAAIPDLLRERTARHPQYLSAAATGPANQAASLFSGPGQNLLLTAATGKVPYFLKRPGEGPELMDVAMMKKGERGKSRGLRQLKAAVAGVNPFGELFGPHFEVEVEGGLQYLEEPIIGIKPFGRIFSTSYEKKHGSGGMAPPAIPPPPSR